MGKDIDIMTFLDGRKVVPYEDVVGLREEKNPRNMIAQRGGQENALASDADIVIAGGNRGGGKALADSELVCTPFGFRQIKDLKPGDIITTRSGGMSRVIYVYEQGEQDVYRMEFSDGTHVDCTLDHLWNVKRTGHNHKSRVLNNTDINSEWRVWTTGMVIDFLNKQSSKKLSKSHSHLLVPLCHPVKFARSFAGCYKPKTSAYVIGALLGDGCFTDYVINRGLAATFTTADDFIKNEFECCGVDMSRCYGKKSKAQSIDIRDNKVREDIINLKLAGTDSSTKFIPDYYKYAPLEVRWALAQGMMDTDGYIDKRGHCSYTTISPRLAEDMAFVLRSLGAYVSISIKKTGYKKNGIYTECANAYELYIKIPESHRLFRLPRKKDRSKPYNGGGSIYGKQIISCKRVRRESCRCIKVNQPDGLFISRDFTVTHNSWMLLMSMLYDIYNPNQCALIVRKERDDLTNLVTKSETLFKDHGTYNRSQDLMCWNFKAGGTMYFSYHAGALKAFTDRLQGREYNRIGIDEITQIDFPKFKYLQTNNRNAFHIKSQLIGTCNPDPDSWVAKFIDWWIGEDGFPIKERDGVLRYCFMNGEDVGDIIWGDTPEAVYEQAKSIIDSVITEGEDWRNYILSVTFIRAELDDNVALMESDPKYKAKLAGQSEEQRQRDLKGNWRFKSAGDDLIKWAHMDAFYKNAAQYGDGVKRVSCDVAFDGGDNLVMWLWVGNHIQDLFVCHHDSARTVEIVKSKLMDWGVREENFTYDLNGVGQTFKGFFPKANPFNNLEAVDVKAKHLYVNLKSQAAYEFAMDLIEGRISINPELLDRKYGGSKQTVREILNIERKAVRRDDSRADKGWALIVKKIMIQLVGHSPDYIEGLIYKKKFDIKKPYRKPRGLGWL